MLPKNVLVIKLRYLGDVLLATPTLRALKAGIPGVRLTVMVNRGTESVLEGNPDIDEVLPLDRGSFLSQCRFAINLRRRRFDAVIDLTDADRSAVLSWISGAPVRIGFNDEGRWRGHCYTALVQSAPSSHRIERDLAALTPLAIDATDLAPRFGFSSADEAGADELLKSLNVLPERPIVVMQPGARYWFKAWPPERFSSLADRLVEAHGCQVLIGGNADEVGLAQEIARLSEHPLKVLAGRTSVRQFAAVVKRAALFVGNDSGAMHIAAAVGTPVIGLFGPSNPQEWGPRGKQVVTIHKGLDCRACFHPSCRRGEENCMKLISMEEVLEAARPFLQLKGRPSESN
jgi:predicted lipopolysaccharide heptosyltransferase III